MTPTQIEAAARELCKMRGEDPDRPAGGNTDPLPDGSSWELQWRSYVPEIERFAQVGTAIAAVMQTPRAPRKRKTK